MAKQSLPTNSMSILNFNVLVAGDNEGMLEKIKKSLFSDLFKIIFISFSYLRHSRNQIVKKTDGCSINAL